MTNTGEFRFATDIPTYALFQSSEYHNNYNTIKERNISIGMIPTLDYGQLVLQLSAAE